MELDEVLQTISRAKETLRIADIVARRAADLATNRLQASGTSHYILCALKRELQRYNMHTQTWSDK